jgi:serine/threonine-protein kinase PpkA
VAPSQPIPAKLAGDVPIVIPGYRLKRKLGEGGMSVVFLADNEESGQEHVLKLMRIGDDEDGDQLQRFISEFALVSQIRHPNVAHIFAQGFSEHHAYIAMEYFPGGDLRLMIEKGMQPDVVLAVLLQVAGALGAIHAEGIVHRDMKPDNVMIRSDGTLALADFGIAKQLNSNMNRTKHGEVFGTPYYLSPEQALGLPVDTRTDIYSLGVMFYEMLTGKKPYRGDNPQALLYQHVNGPMPKLPDELLRYQHLVDRLMAKKPADRMQDADEIINSVVSVINGEASTPFTLDA